MRYPLYFFLLTLFIAPTFIQAHPAAAQSQQYTCTNVAANPDYIANKSTYYAILAINKARQQERLRSLQLPGNFYQLSSVQQQFILVNAERVDRGLRPVILDETLSQMVLEYAQQMATQQFFAHTSPAGVTFVQRINSNPAVRNHYSAAAENLAANPVNGAGPIYEYMYDDARSSCGHRSNILTPQMTHIGIGVTYSDVYGSISVQDFIASASWNPYQPSVRIIHNNSIDCFYEGLKSGFVAQEYSS